MRDLILVFSCVYMHFFVNFLWTMLAILQLSSVMKVGICNQEAASICKKSFLKHLVLHVIESDLFGFFCHKP